MRGGSTNHSGAALATAVGLRVAKRRNTSRPRRALISTIHPSAEKRTPLEVTEVANLSPIGGALKRALDIAIALLVLTLLAPLMGLIAIGIRLWMGGPVIFRQERIGFDGCTFVCLKFRSMVRNADDVLREHLAQDPSAAREWQETQKLRNDPRVSFVGNLLRKSSLDELPQFFNVLRGDMSCVGPRPIIPAELGRYGAHARTCFRARPGITGIWQTNGRNRLSYAERIALDHYYVNHWSFWLDMVLLLKTIPAVLRTDNTS
jgi:exopolysaccharide production protein ExoY